MKSPHYLVSSTQPTAHIFNVTLTIPDPEPTEELWLPTWIPGSYLIREFARNIIDISAKDELGTLNIQKKNKHTWCVHSRGQTLTIDYRVYAWDLSVRMAHLDQNHGYFNGTSIFLAVKGREECTQQVTLEAPKGYPDWKVATTLPKKDGILYSFGEYQAVNYDALIDHPVEMGTFDLLHFVAAGVPHEIAITGRHNTCGDRLCEDLTRICTYFINLFGGSAPMSRYLFQVMVVGSGYGGLEHRDSTSLICARKDVPTSINHPPEGDYLKFLGLCSHEYFHTWNVKRIKPEAYLPYDLSQEAYSTQLWAFEGITSYYDDLALVRCGLITPQSYLKLLAKTITRVQSTPGRHVQSVADSSFDTWIKFYRQDENAPNSLISYYAKGALVALCLDLHLRIHSDVSLDDVMHFLWEGYGQVGVGVPENGIHTIAERLSNLVLDDFFSKYVFGVEELPLAHYLEQMGLKLVFHHSEDLLDHSDRGWIGAQYTCSNSGCLLQNVFTHGPAMNAGLSAKDVIVAIDGLKATEQNIKSILKEKVGHTVSVHAFRLDELHTFSLTIEPAPHTHALIIKAPLADPQDLERQRAWLHIE